MALFDWNNSPYSNISLKDYQKFLSMYGKRGHESGGLFKPAVSGYDMEDPELLQWFQWYNDYLGRIQQYQGTPYYKLLLNNAYAGFQRSGIDPSKEGYQSFWNDRYNNANEELSRVSNLVFENAYNSPSAQVARDKAAGLNDALSGQVQASDSASSAPDETPPTPGVDPTAAAQNELIDEQNRYNRVIGGVGTALNFVTSVIGCFGALGQIIKLGSDVAVNASVKALQDKKAFEIEEAIKGQKIANRESAKSSFMDSLVGSMSLPEDGSSYDIRDLVSGVSRAGFGPDEDAYIQSLIDSGYFYDENGSPTSSVLDAYNNKAAGIASNSRSFATDVSNIGGLNSLKNASSAVNFVTEKVANHQFNILQNQARVSQLSTELNFLEIAIKQEIKEQERLNTGIVRADAAAAQYESLSRIGHAQYDMQLFGIEQGARDNRLKNLVAKYQTNLTELQSIQVDVNKSYYNAVKQIQEKLGSNPWVQINSIDFIDNAGKVTSGFVSLMTDRYERGMDFLQYCEEAGVDLAMKRIPDPSKPSKSSKK